MKRLTSIRYDERTEDVLNELHRRMLKDESRNKLVNKLLFDYASAILKIWEDKPKVSYDQILRSLIDHKGDDRLDRLIKHEIKVNDKLNELLYIQLYANHQLMVNDDYMDNAKSMYKRGTPIFYIRQKARDLVEQDNIEMFGRLQHQRRMGIDEEH